jgi:hypothetical protein
MQVIAADGEMRASKALREASSIIEQSPAALQLRYLQVLQNFQSSSSDTFRYCWTSRAPAQIPSCNAELPVLQLRYLQVLQNFQSSSSDTFRYCRTSSAPAQIPSGIAELQVLQLRYLQVYRLHLKYHDVQQLCSSGTFIVCCSLA